MLHGSGAERFHLVNVCASTGSAVLCFCLDPSAADSHGFCFCQMIDNNAAIQLREDRTRQKLDTDTTLKHPVNFQNNTLCTKPDHILLNVIAKMSLCVEPGLKSTDQRFSEAMTVCDSVIRANLNDTVTAAVWLCFTLSTIPGLESSIH